MQRSGYEGSFRTILKASKSLSTFQWWRAQCKRREAAKPVTPFLPITMHAVSVVEVELRSQSMWRSGARIRREM